MIMFYKSYLLEVRNKGGMAVGFYSRINGDYQSNKQNNAL